MKPLPPPEGKISQAHTSGIFLEKPGLLKEALERQEVYNSIVPGSFVGQNIEKADRTSTLEKALLKLKEDQATGKMGRANGDVVNPNDDGQLTLVAANGDTATQAPNGDDGEEFEDFQGNKQRTRAQANFYSTPEADITLNIQKANEESPGIIKQGNSKDPVVVFIRHGRTPHNNLGLFTGWADPPLAPDGVEDAKNAGRLLKLHGFEFDVVYTSWLQRAIETACK